VHTNQRGGTLSHGVDLAPGQNPHVNFEPSIHNGLVEGERKPYNGPELHGRLTTSVLERRNDYVQARARYATIEKWERDDLVKNLSDLLGQCERDVQERMVWHFLLVHDDLGTRVGEAIGVRAKDVKGLEPLTGQILTDQDKARIATLGKNGDALDAKAWGVWTASVPNHQAMADDVMRGMKGVKIAK